jgi:hypothetical protein
MTHLSGKVVPVLFFNPAPRHEGVLWESRYRSAHSLTSALDGSEWSASRPGRFTPRETAPGTHWIGGWMGPMRMNIKSAAINFKDADYHFCCTLCISPLVILSLYLINEPDRG